MKSPVMGPVFACLYPGLCEIARANGYALAIHGTLTSDMDLIAVPWTEEAGAPIDLWRAMTDHIGACGYADLLRRDTMGGLTESNIQQLVYENNRHTGPEDAEIKPHRRLAWNLYLYAGAKVDLSIVLPDVAPTALLTAALELPDVTLEDVTVDAIPTHKLIGLLRNLRACASALQDRLRRRDSGLTTYHTIHEAYAEVLGGVEVISPDIYDSALARMAKLCGCADDRAFEAKVFWAAKAFQGKKIVTEPE